MIERLEDTIVAISSAPGYGAIGVVRLSGPRAIAMADRFLRSPSGNRLRDQAGSTRWTGDVLLDAESIVPAFAYVFRKPRSYTRQDLVEIYSVGSPVVLELVRRRAVALGAEPAQPGEFTARAFLNGALALSQAEAVAGLINAESDVQLRAARRMMDGTLGRQTDGIREKLAELLALVEADIDFAEEPIDFIKPDELTTRLGQLEAELREIEAQATVAERLDGLPRILLFGAPNSGKSTLLNRLSDTNRAICAAVAGTTRDILSAPIRLPHGEAILLDAAGVDRSADEIIAAARELTLSTANRVDATCIVVDASVDADAHVLELAESFDVPTIVAVSKCDLVDPDRTGRVVAALEARKLGPVVPISAVSGVGLTALGEALESALGGCASTVGGEAIVLNERQRAALGDAAGSLRRASERSAGATDTIDAADVIAFELREALDTLGTVTGAVATEDLLSHIFANFCIGK